MDTDYYVNIVTECLNNTEVYQKSHPKSFKTSMNRVKSFVHRNKICFDKYNNNKQSHEAHYIKSFDYKPANFYGLPKIHKSKIIQDILSKTNNVYVKLDAPVDLPFRFITAGPASPTSKLSEFLDILLKPFYTVIPSYIRDTTDFLNKLPHFPPDELADILIVTCDVKNMYNNIHQSLGLEAVNFWFKKHPELLHKRFTANFVIEALKLVLNNSQFMFNDECFSLKTGTATGTTVR